MVYTFIFFFLLLQFSEFFFSPFYFHTLPLACKKQTKGEIFRKKMYCGEENFYYHSTDAFSMELFSHSHNSRLCYWLFSFQFSLFMLDYSLAHSLFIFLLTYAMLLLHFSFYNFYCFISLREILLLFYMLQFKP